MNYIKEIYRTIRNIKLTKVDTMYYEFLCYILLFTILLSMCS